MTPVTPRHFAWQARRLATSTFVLRGRRGTWRHLPSFCVAGVALMALGGALGSVLVAGDAGDAAALCVAGVAWRHPPLFHVAGAALGDIYLRFAWQAWHLWHWRHGTWRHPPFCFTWQARHLATSTFVSRGRRGTWRHLPSFCVAGVALIHWVARLDRFWSRVTPVTPRHFAWQRWHT